MDLKSLLKNIKSNESFISTVLGVAVIAIVLALVFNYFKNLPKNLGQIGSGETTQEQMEGGYTVAPGDSLWSIALKKYGSGFEWQRIAEANQLTNPDLLEVGQKLTLPSVEKLESDNEAIVGGTYTVAQGDCLWDIAVRTYGDGYRWVEIAQENDLDNPNLIHAGNVFTLPR